MVITRKRACVIAVAIVLIASVGAYAYKGFPNRNRSDAATWYSGKISSFASSARDAQQLGELDLAIHEAELIANLANDWKSRLAAFKSRGIPATHPTDARASREAKIGSPDGVIEGVRENEDGKPSRPTVVPSQKFVTDGIVHIAPDQRPRRVSVERLDIHAPDQRPRRVSVEPAGIHSEDGKTSRPTAAPSREVIDDLLPHEVIWKRDDVIIAPEPPTPVEKPVGIPPVDSKAFASAPAAAADNQNFNERLEKLEVRLDRILKVIKAL